MSVGAEVPRFHDAGGGKNEKVSLLLGRRDYKLPLHGELSGFDWDPYQKQADTLLTKPGLAPGFLITVK